MYFLGHSVKKIRTSKALTQSYISKESLITQSNYSKFEKGLIDIRASSFINILNSMDIPLQEFIYIHNEYKLDYKEELLNHFFDIPFHNIAALDAIQKKCQDYLEQHDSTVIKDLNTLIDALKEIYKNNDFNKAQKIAAPIWNRLCNNNELFLYDLYFMNAIFYIFIHENEIPIINFLIRGYEKYKKYPHTLKLFINIHVNLSLLLIEHGNYNEALKTLDTVQHICKKQRLYFQLAIIYIRQGICKNNLNQHGHSDIVKGLQWLDSFEEFDALTIMQEEVKLYANIADE